MVYPLDDAEHFFEAGEFMAFRLSKPELFEAGFTIIKTIVHHYTDLNGLIGIVESQSLFASDIRFVNDKAELQYGLDLFKEVAQSLYHKDSRSVLPHLIDNLTRFFPANRYITCFSTNGDLLQQWQSYANNATGVSIAFDFFSTGWGGIQLTPSINARKIIYDKKKQVELIKIQVESTLEFFQPRLLELPQDQYAEVVSNFMVDSISSTITSLKHPCFAHENEYRFLYLPDEGASHSIKFRTNGKMIIPYVKLETPYRYYINEMKKPDNDWGVMPTIAEAHKLLPIKEITIGPGLDYESVREGIEILLKENSYKEVNIIKSDLPYRV